MTEIQLTLTLRQAQALLETNTPAGETTIAYKDFCGALHQIRLAIRQFRRNVGNTGN